MAKRIDLGPEFDQAFPASEVEASDEELLARYEDELFDMERERDAAPAVAEAEPESVPGDADAELERRIESAKTLNNENAFDPEHYHGTPGSPPVKDKQAYSRKQWPKKVSHRMKYIVQLAAMGCTGPEIQERTGYSLPRIHFLLNAPIVSNLIELERKHLFNTDPVMSLKRSIPTAVNRIVEALEHEAGDFKEKRDQSAIAFQLIERTHGKPQQSIEMKGSLLADIYDMLESRVVNDTPIAARGRHVDAEDAEIAPGSSPEQPENQKDKFDAYLDKNLPALKEHGK